MADSYDSTAEAQRLLNVIDARIAAATGSTVIRTFGIVAAVSSATRECDVYLYGQTVASVGFRMANGDLPAVGDRVRVAMDAAVEDRWVEEVITSSVYHRLVFDHKNGQVLVGDGTTPATTALSPSTHTHAGYEATGVAAGLDATHAAAADPHTGYQKESEKDAANGYVGLSGSSAVSIAGPLQAASVALGSNRLWRFVPVAQETLLSGATPGSGDVTVTPTTIPTNGSVKAVSVTVGIRESTGANQNMSAKHFDGNVAGVTYTSGVAARGGFSCIGLVITGGTNNVQFKYATTAITNVTIYIYVHGYWTDV